MDSIFYNSRYVHILVIFILGMTINIYGIINRVQKEVRNEDQINYKIMPVDVFLAVLRGVIVLAWIGIIMGFSGDNGEESGNISKGLLIDIYDLLGIEVNHSVEIMGQFETFLIYEKILRKAAHMIEYGILSVLMSALCYSIVNIKKKQALVTGILVAFITGVMDEAHQYFVADRYSSFLDVLVDSLGAFIALMLFSLIVDTIKKYCKKKAISPSDL